MSTTPQQSPTPPTSGGGPRDPFERLHRMSTTAGVGAHDYVAVNTPAVLAIVAGGASALSLVSPVLLIVPAFAVLCAVLAFFQISRSNGTQTGRMLAVGGILLAILCSGSVVYREFAQAQASSATKAQIHQVLNSFQSTTAGAEYAKTYDLFGPGFQNVVKPDVFRDFLTSFAASSGLGKIKSISWNELLDTMPEDPTQEVEFTRVMVSLNFEKSDSPLPCTVLLSRRKLDNSAEKGPWKIEELSPLFDRIAKKEPAGGPGGGGPPR